MAARFDAADAASRGFQAGDGIPIHLTIPVDRPWVPLRILAAAKPTTEVVAADIFLLTDERPSMLAGRGMTLNVEGEASSSLLSDLRSDAGMAWVPTEMWLSHVQLDVPAGDLGYDLAIGIDGEAPRDVDTGLAPAMVRTTLAEPLPAAASPSGSDDGGMPLWIVLVAPMGAVGLLALAVSVAGRRPQQTPA
jgi:hypothetical protein